VIIMARVTPEVVQLFTLEFVLDSFAIWCIPNQRKYGSDPLDKYGPLRSISVVERSLNTIIPIGISQQLLEPRSV